MANGQDDLSHLYRTQARWLRDVVDDGGSLLDDKRVWTEETIEEARTHFIGQPDSTPDKKFLDKLHDQMAGASPEAVQLMAELLILHFLHISTSTIKATTKLHQIETVLSWMPFPPQVPQEISAAMEPGILHPGQWALARRDTQLTWMLEFARAWANEPNDSRHQLLADPWRFRDFAAAVTESTSISADSTVNAELAFLHMTFPQTFEAIVTPLHKKLIADRYPELNGGETDVDRQLLAIRKNMELAAGKPIDWYDDISLALTWKRDPKLWNAFSKWATRFQQIPDYDSHERHYKISIATRLAAVREMCRDDDPGWTDALKAVIRSSENNLTSWRGHDKFLAWITDDPSTARSTLLDLWTGDSELGPALDRFAESVPHTVLATIGERTNMGSVLLMALGAEDHPPLKISVIRKAWQLVGWPKDQTEKLSAGQIYERSLSLWDTMLYESKSWDTPLRDRLDAQSVTYGIVNWPEPPEGFTTGEWQQLLEYKQANGAFPDEASAPFADEPAPGLSVADDNLAPPVDHIALAATELCVDREVLDEIVELLDDKGQAVLYGPPGTGKTYLALRLARAMAGGANERVSIVQFHPATTYEDFIEGLRPSVENGQVVYRLVPGPLIRIAEQARQEPGATFVLVIDEINRANFPKVVGELLLLLEHRSEQVRLIHRPDDPFSLPTNLKIIGTMNTADRSIALIDAAMRRRFHFVGFFPHIGPMPNLLRRWLEENGGRRGVASLLDAVNNELAETVGDHLLVGPSHFMKSDLSDRALQRIWEHNVFPLVEELFWGDRTTIDQWRWPAVRNRHATALDGHPEPPSDDGTGNEQTENDDSGAPSPAA